MRGSSDTFGQRFSELLAERGLKQTQAARILECSSGFISDVVNDVKRPGLDFLERVQDRFDVSLDWLVGGRGLPDSPRPIEIQPHRLIVGAVEIARAGLVDGNSEALDALEDLLRQFGRSESFSSAQIEALQRWADDAETALLAAGIHNTQLGEPSLSRRVHVAITTALAMFQSRRAGLPVPAEVAGRDSGHPRVPRSRVAHPRLTTKGAVAS